MRGEALAIEADVSKAADVERYVRETVARFGGVDVLFNNAGVLGPAAAMSLIYFAITLLVSWLFYTLMTRDDNR